MKLTTGILVITVMAASAKAQSPNIIQNTHDRLNAVQQQKAADSNAALDASSGQAKPTPSKPAASTGKPAPTKPAPTSKPASVGANAGAAQPKTNTVAAKPVAVTVERTPTTATAKSNPGAVEKANTHPPVKAPATGATAAATPVQKTSVTPAKKTPVPTGSQANVAPASAGGKGGPRTKSAPKTEKVAAGKAVVVVVPKPVKSAKKAPSTPVQVGDKAAPEKERKFAMTGKRDPFLSPVVSHVGSSSCNTGKKCLEIGQINLRGVVRSDTGMIAVVTNSLNKAYFLRENDPVFNGYVERITADSITFKETLQDKLGKPFTRDVVKKILTPAV